MQQILNMSGGTGDESYAKNSNTQKANLSSSLPVLSQAVLDFCDTKLPQCVAIADLGCSSGPNTLFAVTQITSMIRKRCSQLGQEPRQFSVFLNDLPGNDFNTVFQSFLTTFHEKIKAENGPDFGACYIAAVAGSFYGRLFPSNSLHFVHSGTSLHWLSQVPPELSDKSNPVINKGKIFISKTSPPAVIEAYQSQFRKDFFSFLKSRSKEVVPGGCMVFTLRARRFADPTTDESCLLWDYIGQAFQYLVSQMCFVLLSIDPTLFRIVFSIKFKENEKNMTLISDRMLIDYQGLMGEEKLDAYNIPSYEASMEEIKTEIEKEGSFALKGLEIIALPWDACNRGEKLERATTAKNMVKAVRAITETMIRNDFGVEILNPLFERMREIIGADTKEIEHVSAVVYDVRRD